jgi:hypothetical protein
VVQELHQYDADDGALVVQNIDAASKSAQTACLTHGTSCTKTASLCADGSNYYHWRGARFQ